MRRGEDHGDDGGTNAVAPLITEPVETRPRTVMPSKRRPVVIIVDGTAKAKSGVERETSLRTSRSVRQIRMPEVYADFSTAAGGGAD